MDHSLRELQHVPVAFAEDQVLVLDMADDQAQVHSKAQRPEGHALALPMLGCEQAAAQVALERQHRVVAHRRVTILWRVVLEKCSNQMSLGSSLLEILDHGCQNVLEVAASAGAVLQYQEALEAVQC